MTIDRDMTEEEFEDDAPNPAPEDGGAENTIDEFVEYFNARDVDGLASLLARDIDVEFLKVAGAVNALEALEDLFVREPHVLATRGERGVDPIVGLWQPAEVDKDTDTGDDDTGRYVAIGFLLFEWSEDHEPLITRIEFVEELDGDVVVEEPDDPVEILDWEIGQDD